MHYFLKVNAKILQNFDSRGSLFQPVWIYERLKTPTLNFRAVGVFGSPLDKFAFSVLFVRLFAWKCFLIIQLFSDINT